MSKKLFIKTLNMMAKHFHGHGNVIEAIDYLLEVCDQIEEPAIETATPVFSLPQESLRKGNCLSLFTDGACRGNPGPGAWAFMAQVKDGEVLFQESGLDPQTTNNKMELTAVVEALLCAKKYFEDNSLKYSSPVLLYSDSKYVLDGMHSWIEGWKARGWKKADNKAPENIELWKMVDQLKSNFSNLELVWVKGHAGHPQNEHCDKLANSELDINGF
jgi:ribonuclease HI